MTKYSDYNTRHDAINKALQAIKNTPDGFKISSTRSIARDYDIHEATLRCAIKNDSPLPCPGRTKILTNYEKKQLVGYCLNMQKLSFGLTKSGVNQCIMDIVH